MKNSQDPKNTQDVKPKDEPETAQPNNTTENLIPDSASISASSNEHKKVSREDIELVQNLIERCLQLYMNRDEVVRTLLNRARIDPGFTTLVWQKLEEENADFFRAYYIRLKLKKQIILFNHLLEHQYNVTKYPMPPKVPLAPMQNGIHPIPMQPNLPIGYPVLQQPLIPPTGQPHFDPMCYPPSACHVVNGVPVPPNYHPMRIDSGNEMAMANSAVDATPIMAPNNAMSNMSDIAVSPASVASSGHFPFSASEISGMGVDAAAVGPDFTPDVARSVGLELPSDNGAGSSRDPLLSQIRWNFSFSDLTADLSNLGDLGALGNYPTSPFLPSDSDILLDSPEQDGIVEEFFVDSDSIPGQQAPSDEEKP